MAAATAFFESAKAVTGVTSLLVTTDGHDSYRRAIKTKLGTQIRHRNSHYLKNRIEQDHRGIKSRYGPTRGLGSGVSAARFFVCYDELRNHLDAGRRFQTRPPSAHRGHFIKIARAALTILTVA